MDYGLDWRTLTREREKEAWKSYSSKRDQEEPVIFPLEEIMTVKEFILRVGREHYWWYGEDEEYIPFLSWTLVNHCTKLYNEPARRPGIYVMEKETDGWKFTRTNSGIKYPAIDELLMCCILKDYQKAEETFILVSDCDELINPLEYPECMLFGAYVYREEKRVEFFGKEQSLAIFHELFAQAVNEDRD